MGKVQKQRKQSTAKKVKRKYEKAAAKFDQVPARLRLSYFALRHGESKANVAKKIVSDPRIGCTQYGLSDAGHAAVESAGKAFGAGLIAGGNSKLRVAVFASDFLRTKETAQVFMDAAEAAVRNRRSKVFRPLKLSKSLRERFFGSLEGQSTVDGYSKCWEVDCKDPDSTPFGAESVTSVRKRTVAFIHQLEEDRTLPNGSAVILVSHGDSLQILQTAFEGVDGCRHRSLKPLQTAEVRRLGRK
eukprot:gnl/MRDRNA2_/MRDRNA2_127823_c0_seq1.p1 gnl/MRDRNA2_/MRDRNA2_127823_c0~~gnl/MRDRNA2_/MRDRNA2_127823_c0_seq1.p1  ORF type:complete len:244 (+),score=47.67 gnl/MRDRNA2_/MRDRNA2_127823_c0_seq1:192-923(+)